MHLGEICRPIRNTYRHSLTAPPTASDRFCAIYNGGLAACLEETGVSALIVDFTWKNGA